MFVFCRYFYFNHSCDRFLLVWTVIWIELMCTAYGILCIYCSWSNSTTIFQSILLKINYYIGALHMEIVYKILYHYHYCYQHHNKLYTGLNNWICWLHKKFKSVFKIGINISKVKWVLIRRIGTSRGAIVGHVAWYLVLRCILW